MTASGICHMRLELFVCDPARSLRFYEDVLGFEIDESAPAATADYIPIVNGNARIALGLAGALPDSHHFQPLAGARLGVGAEIVLEVEQLGDYEARAARHCAMKEPKQLRPWGLWDFRIVDPDGYYIRVTECRAPTSSCRGEPPRPPRAMA